MKNDDRHAALEARLAVFNLTDRIRRIAGLDALMTAYKTGKIGDLVEGLAPRAVMVAGASTTSEQRAAAADMLRDACEHSTRNGFAPSADTIRFMLIYVEAIRHP